VIVDYAGDEDVGLVAMGTHGRRGVDRMLFGSVTEEVVRRAPCPVFTVRKGAEVAPGEAVHRVLAPVDFSEASETAVRHAKEVALTYGAEINLLHVVEEPLYPAAYGMEPVEFSTQDVIDQVEQRLGDLVREEIGYEHALVGAQVGHPPTAILEYVDENEVDLIVIATRGRTGLERILLGSVTERVLRRSPVPVFVVKPDRKSLLSSDCA
jgi:nucleotide-binding universal stress UspA family protein